MGSVSALLGARRMNPFAPTPEPENWRLRAACAGTDTDAFFPERGADISAAIAVCRGCRVLAPCLAYALDNDVVGVWGGTSARERVRILRRQRRAS